MEDVKELHGHRLSEVTYWNSRGKAPLTDKKHPARHWVGFVDDKRCGVWTHVVKVIRTQWGVHMKESRLKQG